MGTLRLILIAVFALILGALYLGAGGHVGQLFTRLDQADSLRSYPPASAEFYADEAYRSVIEQSKPLLQPLMKEYPGLTFAVGASGKLVWSEGLGYADLESMAPPTSASQFRAYSLIKPVTALVALKLSQQGVLDLDAPIGRYLPALPDPYQAITARQLIGHQGGVRHYKSGEWLTISSQHCERPEEALDVFLGDPLRFEPGADASYSSFGYVLLSAVLEAASGTPFARLLQEEVFAPAGMSQTELDDPTAKRPARSTFYEQVLFGKVAPARPVDNTCKWGGGGFLSTAEDLVKFGTAFLGGELTDLSAVKLALTPMTRRDGEPTGTGFAWGLGTTTESGIRYALHTGSALGGKGVFLLFPDFGVVVAALGNIEVENNDLVNAAAEIAQLFAQAQSARAGI